MHHRPRNPKIILSIFSLLIVTISVVALALTFVAAPAFDVSIATDAIWWYLFSFLSGLISVVLPCSLPVIFVVVPLALGSSNIKSPERAMGMIFAFALGVMLILSIYGAVVAYFGGWAMSFFHLKSEMVMNWMYYFTGIFAYILALGEIGLVNIRMPAYVGRAPLFIEKRKDHMKMFLLGIFLGNIGIGCPNPAIPLLLLNAGASGSAVYGALLFLVHGAGRAAPLIVMTMLATLGWNGLRHVVREKESIERASGWIMLYVSAFVLTLGLFTHAWLTSGTHTLFTNLLGYENSHIASDSIRGILGQPLGFANWLLVILWLAPLWWYFARERSGVNGAALIGMHKLEQHIDRLELERRGLAVTLHIPVGAQAARTCELLHKIDILEKERRILEDGMRYGVHKALEGEKNQHLERAALILRRNWYVTISILVIIIFVVTI